MDISPNAAVNAVLNQQQAQSLQSVQISVFKKALDLQKNGILQLIASLPNATPRAGLPDHIGTQINTQA
ncbi:Putative motility protein [Sulfurivirga caldicuralii]|uniref:Putative motility protein n=1 Tax=Sulfurivirga caldicuralii TaxID=364032 RepID=A0A1N6DP36_9GAMM|nr:YjfB family protein [Sulfurivirga caldicuralii]SIN72569.1 Putative motility protein [Sulfurivirga caldicuralii]